MSEAITKVKVEGGFDSSSTSSSDDTIRGWINEAVKTAIATALWRKQVRELGPTVADQADYALPDDVVDVRAVRVANSRPWIRASTEDMWEFASNYRALAGAPGAFAPDYDENATALVRLFPVPDEAGQSIEALVAIVPPALTTGAQTIPLPDDVVEKIAVSGAIGIGLHRVEERHEDAAVFDAVWAEGRDELKRRAKSRVGSGPAQAKIYGTHF